MEMSVHILGAGSGLSLGAIGALILSIMKLISWFTR